MELFVIFEESSVNLSGEFELFVCLIETYWNDELFLLVDFETCGKRSIFDGLRKVSLVIVVWLVLAEHLLVDSEENLWREIHGEFIRVDWRRWKRVGWVWLTDGYVLLESDAKEEG